MKASGLIPSNLRDFFIIRAPKGASSREFCQRRTSYFHVGLLQDFFYAKTSEEFMNNSRPSFLAHVVTANFMEVDALRLVVEVVLKLSNL